MRKPACYGRLRSTHRLLPPTPDRKPDRMRLPTGRLNELGQTRIAPWLQQFRHVGELRPRRGGRAPFSGFLGQPSCPVWACCRACAERTRP